MIDEMRKYKVSLTLAHQRLRQFDVDDRNAISNCMTQIYFAVNGEDAGAISRGLCDRIEPADLTDLGLGEMIVRIDTEIDRVQADHPGLIPITGLRDEITKTCHARYYRCDADQVDQPESPDDYGYDQW
jgi:hypothetical protein